jgi:hypothetical protein
MWLLNQHSLDSAQMISVQSEVIHLGSLQEVVRWGFAQSPAAQIVDVVVQDEFCHDVVMHLGKVFLVFDTT